MTGQKGNSKLNSKSATNTDLEINDVKKCAPYTACKLSIFKQNSLYLQTRIYLYNANVEHR